MAVAPTQDVKAYKNYIGGEWVEAASGETFEVENPSSGEIVATVPKGGREDAQRAIAAARESFDSGVWAEMDPDERVRIMRSVVDKFTEHEDELAELESLQSGMTMRATATVVIGYCINHWDYFARQAARPRQEALEPVSFPTHSYNFVLREPIGVCAGIIPWNFPLVMAVWKLAPALAMGNSVVLKPASNTPLTALRLAELLDETDLPKGVVNIITGGGATVGEELASHPDVDKVVLHRLHRGRAADHAAGVEHDQEVHAGAGRQVAEHRVRGRRTSTRRSTALSGPPSSTRARCASRARGCCCRSRSTTSSWRSSSARAKQIKIGDALDYDSDMGPLVSAEQLETVVELRAHRPGGGGEARAAAAGARPTLPRAGTSSSPRSSPTSTTR